jgi:hypothetical protein
MMGVEAQEYPVLVITLSDEESIKSCKSFLKKCIDKNKIGFNTNCFTKKEQQTIRYLNISVGNIEDEDE